MITKEIIKKYLLKTGININECTRCKNVWVSNRKNASFVPKFCPNCKSPYWNKKRVSDMTKKEREEHYKHKLPDINSILKILTSNKK